MKKILLQLTFLFSITLLSAQTQQGNTLIGENTSDQSGTSVAINDFGTYAIVGAPSAVSAINGGISQRGGHVRTYGYNGTVWTGGADFDAEDAGDRFGTSVAMSGNASIIACGAPGGDPNGVNTGYVHVYIAQGDPQAPIGYIRYGNDIDGEAGRASFGSVIAMNDAGTRIVIGGNNYVKVYENTNFSTPWVQIGQTLVGEFASDSFGVSVGMDFAGNRIVIGNSESDGTAGTNTGYARVYEFNGTSWVQIGQDIVGSSSGDNAGSAVDITHNGARIAVGFPGDDNVNGVNAGAVRIFDFNGTSWSQIGSDIRGVNSGTALGGSGTSSQEGALDMNSDGTLVVVGSKTDGTTNATGYMQEYQLTTFSGNWMQIGSTINGVNANDEFGFAVAMNADGSIIMGGAKSSDDNGSNSGHSRVFDNSANVLNVKDVDELAQVVMYPNPTKGTITLLNQQNIGLEKLSIYDITGRLIQTFDIKNLQSEAVLDTSILSPGNYTVVLFGKTGKTTKKLIKN